MEGFCENVRHNKKPHTNRLIFTIAYASVCDVSLFLTVTMNLNNNTKHINTNYHGMIRAEEGN